MAKQIKINTGSEQYEIANENGTIIGRFEINPTDVNLIKRFDDIQKFFSEYDYSSLSNEDGEDNIDKIIEFSDKVTERLNYLLGYKATDDLFSFCSPIAYVDGEKLYFEVLVEMLQTIILDGMKEHAAESKSKVSAATEGY